MATHNVQLTDAGNTVPYNSAAAGHEGISTSADGSLLIKPCTQAEIDFYESAKDHPAFQAHMPTYMGSLSLGDSEIQAKAGILQTQQNDTTEPTFSAPARSSTLHRRGDSGHIVSDPKIHRSATKEWTPSGGAKLTSSLSIVLSNATAGFRKPNVIDLKLGARLWDDDAPIAKRNKLDEVSNTSTSGSLGFRVAGMKVYVGDNVSDNILREVNTDIADGYKTFNKFYGRESINEKNIAEAFEAFLSSLALDTVRTQAEDPELRKRKQMLKRKLLIERLHREVSSMEYVIENEESRMYSASILMVYEGDPTAIDEVILYKERNGRIVSAQAVESDDDEEAAEQDGEDDEEDEAPKQRIHEAVMIDFAHAHWTPGRGADTNILKGIKSIREILELLLDNVEDALEKS